MEVKKGDWVRFYKGGELVIGVVEYITKHPVLCHREVATNIGTIKPNSILEVRSTDISISEESHERRNSQA